MTGRYIIALTFLIGFMVGIVSTPAEIAGASESPAGKTTHCRLDVVVDPAAKKISGTMDILADLQKAFEVTAGQDLTAYFQQWVYDTGIADLNMTDIQTDRKAQGYEVRFSILQKGKNYRIAMPVTFYFDDKKQTKSIGISEAKESFTFIFDKPPTEIVLDEKYDVFRR